MLVVSVHHINVVRIREQLKVAIISQTVKSFYTSYIFFPFSPSDERHNAVHLPSAGWEIQAQEHTVSIRDEGTLTCPSKFHIHVFCFLLFTALWSGLVCHTQVSKPTLGDVLNCLKIEVSDITITLSARWAADIQNSDVNNGCHFQRNLHIQSGTSGASGVLYFCISLQFCWRKGGLVPHAKSSHSGPRGWTLHIWRALQWGRKNNFSVTQ